LISGDLRFVRKAAGFTVVHGEKVIETLRDSKSTRVMSHSEI